MTKVSNEEQSNNANVLLADSLPLFTMDEVGRMIYEFMGQYHLEGKYNHCQHTIEAIQEYKQDKLRQLKR